VRPALQALARTAPTAAERGYAGPVSVPLPSGSPASCAVVAIVLPADARFVGYRYEAVDGWGGGDCLAGQPCAISGAQWEGHPTIERGERTVVWSVFANASPERTRRGRLTAYFRPAPEWAAPQ
jgi:hypothetical protein